MAARIVHRFTKLGKSTFMPNKEAMSVNGNAMEAKTVRMRKMSLVFVVSRA